MCLPAENVNETPGYCLLEAATQYTVPDELIDELFYLFMEF